MRWGVPIWALGAGVNVPREKTRSDWMLGDDRGASGSALVSRETGASGAASGVSEFLGASGASGLACTTNDPARAHRVGQCKPRETLALPAHLSRDRARAIGAHANKWANGTVLHYAFIETAQAPWPEAQKSAMRAAFQTWKDIGIGLSFVEISSDIDPADPDADLESAWAEAEVRIGFDQSDGSWSWMGTDMLRNDDRGRNMNLGWDLTNAWGHATALQQIGHLLGLDHAHRNPNAGIEWNEERLLSYYSAAPNGWNASRVRAHFLTPHEDDAGNAAREWDPYSIMHHPVPPNHIVRPERWRGGIAPNLKLSDGDMAWARANYPEIEEQPAIGVLDLKPVTAQDGAQSNFTFTPCTSRTYAVKLLGQGDAKIVVFEQREGQWRYFDGADFSGQDGDAQLCVRLVKGRQYAIRTRIHYAAARRGAAVVIV